MPRALLIYLCVCEFDERRMAPRLNVAETNIISPSASENGTNRTVGTSAGSASLDLGVKLSRGLQDANVNL